MERRKRSTEREREQREGRETLGRREKVRTEGKKTSHLAVHTNMACGKKSEMNISSNDFPQLQGSSFVNLYRNKMGKHDPL